MPFDKIIVIQIMDEATETWKDLYKLHARVNKTGGSETFNAGASRSSASRTFEVRYFRALEAISLHSQIYRIVYREHPYNIKDYDDYMEKHKTVKLFGEAY